MATLGPGVALQYGDGDLGKSRLPPQPQDLVLNQLNQLDRFVMRPGASYYSLPTHGIDHNSEQPQSFNGDLPFRSDRYVGNPSRQPSASGKTPPESRQPCPSQ